MGRGSIRVMLALTLAAGMLLSAVPVSAEPSPQSQQTQRYFPWVPYGEVISDPRGFPDSGPYYGLVTVQNLENAAIEITLRRTVSYPPDPFQFIHWYELSSRESVTFLQLLPPALDNPAVQGSSGMRIDARFVADESPARIAAVMRQVSASIPANPGETTGAHITVSGYTSLSYAGIAPSPRVIPVAQTNNNWNTLVRITNFETQDTAFVTMTLRPQDGSPQTQLPSVNIPAGKTHTLDMLDVVPEGWVGSVNISSGFNVAAVAERVKNETNMLLINTSRSAVQTNQVQVAPLVFRNWNHWNTGISLVNLDNLPNDITVTYFSPEGGVVHVDEITLPGWRMDFIYMPAGQGQPFVGSARIEGERDFIATVDEVKYFGGDGDTGHAMSYHADYLQAEPGQSLAVPLFRKGNPQTGGGDTSGVQIFNLFGQATVDIRVVDSGGQSALGEPLVINLGPHEGYTFYSMDRDDLPIGFTGSVIIRNVPMEEQNSAIYAVSNLVNYDVQFDGSAAFNTRWFVTPPTEIVPPPVIIMP
jgi:hypothetical protein